MERSSGRPRKKINYALLAKGGGIVTELNTADRSTSSGRLSIPSSPRLTGQQENQKNYLSGECSTAESQREPQKLVSVRDEASRRNLIEEGSDTGGKDIGRRMSSESRDPSGECKERSMSRDLPETLLSGRSPRKRTRSIILSRYDDDDKQLPGNGKRGNNRRPAGRCLAGANKTDPFAQWTLVNSVPGTFKEFALPREWLRHIPKSQVKTCHLESTSSSPHSKDTESDRNIIFSTRSVVDESLKFNRSGKKGTYASFSRKKPLNHSINEGSANERPKDRIVATETSHDKEEEYGQMRLGRRPTRVPAALSEYDLGRHPLIPQISRNATMMIKRNLGDSSERLSKSSERNLGKIRRDDDSGSKDFQVSRRSAVSNSVGSLRKTVLVDAGIPRKKPSLAVALAKTRTTKGIGANGTRRRGSEGRREHAKAGFYSQLLKSADVGRLNAKKRNAVSLKKDNKNRSASP